MTKIIDLDEVTRITVVTEDGEVFQRHFAWLNPGVELHLQDDGRTLKVFPKQVGGDDV